MKTAFLIILFITANLVCKGNESTNIFSNEEELYNKDNPKMIWSETTNFWTADLSGKYIFLAKIKAGIDVDNGVIVLSGNPPKLVRPVRIGFANDSTNFINSTLPKANEWLILNMLDTNGAPIPKTTEGLALGQSPSLKTNILSRYWGRYGYGATLFSHNVNMYDFDPTKYFILKEPGLYKLTIVQRLYVNDTNTFLKAITLPPVTVDVRVEK